MGKAMVEREGGKVMETSWQATVQGTGGKEWFTSYVYFKVSSHINSVGFPPHVYGQASTMDWKSTMKYPEKRHT